MCSVCSGTMPLTFNALFQYGIILDAGSSHTSMFIYKWPADKQNGTGIVTQHSECHAKGELLYWASQGWYNKQSFAALKLNVTGIGF